MATESWGADPPVDALLFTEGYRFEFFQAVRLLARLFPQRQPVGGRAHPLEETVHFHAHLSLGFPPSAIDAIVRAVTSTEPVDMTVAFMGLTGPMGVLPRHYTELLLRREQRERLAQHVRDPDPTLRDFLDLFNHRLISLFYRAWEKYHLPAAHEHAALHAEEPAPFASYLFALMGLGTAGLRGRLDVPAEALLFYAGLLAQRPHSASALQGLLHDYFAVPVTVIQLCGKWLPLATIQRTALGGATANNVLGRSTLAGSQVWDQQAGFRLRLGPLRFAEFCGYLPTGHALRALVGLTRLYAGDTYDFEIQLVLQAAEIPACQLGATGEHAPRLGWSTWLHTAAWTHDAADTIIVGRLQHEAPDDHERASYGRESEVAYRHTE